MTGYRDVEMPPAALERVDVAKLKPFELMVVAIAEHGGPMSYEAIQAKIAARGRVIPVRSLQKAWHGMPPLRKTAAGELELVRDLDPGAWRLIVFAVEQALGEDPLSKRRARVQEPIDEVSPVSFQELHVALQHRLPSAITAGRLIALALETVGRPISTEEVLDLLGRIGAPALGGSLEACGHNRHAPVHRGPDGLWTVESDSPTLLRARRSVREAVRREQERAEIEARSRARTLETKERIRSERNAHELLWLSATKRFVRTFFARNELVAAAVLDPDSRSFAFFTQLDPLRRALEPTEIAVGLDPRREFELLSLGTQGRQFVDLSPPVKSRKINRSGRTLKITPELVMRGTLGRPHALYQPRKLGADARAGRMDKVRRRLEADLKSLYALHDYAQGHGFVRLRWGFIDETLEVPWMPFGHAPPLMALLEHARYREQEIDVVLHGPPGWSDPWSRAWRCRVEGIDDWNFKLVGRDLRIWAWFPEIYAARVVELGGA